jgi:predicted permease
MLTDIRQAIRALRAAPAFTLIAVGTLMLGIAVNTIAFTLLNSLALRPMPVRDASRVVRIFPVDENGRRHNLVSYPDYQAYRDQLQSFDALVAYIPSEITLSVEAPGVEPQFGLGYAVSANHFPALGFEPSIGRSFTPDEEHSPAAGRVAVISVSIWQRRYASAADVVGKTIVVNGRPFAIVGVGPRRFVGTEPLSPDVWVPLSAQAVLEGSDGLNDRHHAWLLMLGRLKRGVARPSAEQEVSVVAAQLAAAYPKPERPTRAAIAPGVFFPLDPGIKPVIALVMATIALVLVIACANIANLSLARAVAGRRQVAVRLALGAGRWRIVRYQIVESVVVGLLGGAAALLLSAWVLRLLYPIGMSLLPETWGSVVLDLTPDVRVFGYTLLLSLAAGVIFGLAPAVQASSPQLSAALRDDGTFLGAAHGRSIARDALVVVQIAVCLMLLAAAALMARSLQRTQSLDLGFRTAGVVYTHADLRRYGYSQAAAASFHRRLAERARVLPGVTEVAWTTHVPLTGGVVRVPLRPDGHASDTVTKYTAVSSSYFATLGIPIVEGRVFTEEEAAAGAPVALISHALARRFWSDDRDPSGRRVSALGKRISTPRAPYPLTVIGVVKDAVDVAIWREKELSVYVPAEDTRSSLDVQLLVHTHGDRDMVAAELRQAARAFDRNIQIEARPMDDVLRFWRVPAQVAAIAGAVLGGLALVLSAIGIYGMIAYTVRQRTREIGIRLALGARSHDVLALVIGSGVRLIVIGIVAGLAGALLATRFLRVLLAVVDPLDPVAFAAATAFLTVIALAASYLPARRAASVDPMMALRSE